MNYVQDEISISTDCFPSSLMNSITMIFLVSNFLIRLLSLTNKNIQTLVFIILVAKLPWIMLIILHGKLVFLRME